MAFRFPAPWLDKFPDLDAIPIAKHPTMDPSVPPIAHHDAAPQLDPYVPVTPHIAKQWRLYYMATIAWMDSQLGRVLDELEALQHQDDTLVVLHADHGWSLGEHGDWQKFTNWELGARVPLIIRAPWIEASVGKRSAVLAELVDVFPTVSDLSGSSARSPAVVQPQPLSLLIIRLWLGSRTPSAICSLQSAICNLPSDCCVLFAACSFLQGSLYQAVNSWTASP